jgi:hypothetical protein
MKTFILMCVGILLMCGVAHASITIVDTPQGQVTCVQIGNYIKCS